MSVHLGALATDELFLLIYGAIKDEYACITLGALEEYGDTMILEPLYCDFIIGYREMFILIEETFHRLGHVLASLSL